MVFFKKKAVARSDSASIVSTTNGAYDFAPLDTTSNGQSSNTQDISKGEYARRCRALMKLHRDLKALGADTSFDLPRIVVIGSQSAGKSSLVEAVTGISVPRDSGTCTRCPVECTMSSAATSWSCNISLSYDGHREPQSFGPVITDKRDVDLWLRRAQAAILSTSEDKKQWEFKSEQEIRAAITAGKDMTMFTENKIMVDIRDQDLTDLSFVDLPGLIQNSDEASINLIRDLAKKHISSENALILVTIPVSDDIQNQGAVLLAKGADSAGHRTVGVLTKPDILGSGAIGLQQAWKDILDNRNIPENPHYLRHGYYCVRLPDDSQRRQGLSAGDLSANFFDSTKPWSEIRDRGRFGVQNLVDDISALLVQLIEANLPALRLAVGEALRECNDELARLPPAPEGEPLTSVMLKVNAFLRDLRAASVGDTHKTLAQSCRARYRDLRQEILDTCPQFDRTEHGQSHQDALSSASVVLNISDVEQLIETCTAWELPVYTPYDAVKVLIKRFLQEWNEPTENCFEDISGIFSLFIEALAGVHFDNHPRLKAYVLSHVQTGLEERRSTAFASVHKLLEIEQNTYFTQRTDFSEKRAHWVQRYYSTFFPYQENKYREKEHREIQVMATVRAYFQCAYERFTDSVLLMEERELIQSLPQQLESTLFNDLMQKSTPELIERLFAEDENIRQRRVELTARKQQLLKIKSTLDSFSLS